MASIFSSFHLHVRFSVCALALIVAFPAHAEDQPFQLDTAQWMSFDHYKEKTKNTPAEIAPVATKDESSTKTAASAPASTSAALPAIATASMNTPAIAPPTRPINAPVMPGMNKDYDLRVNSTADEALPAQITNIESKPTIKLPEHNWESAADAVKQSLKNGADEDTPPIPVRMSFLPNTHIVPVPSPEPDSYHGRMVAAALSAATPKPVEKPADPAACAAIDAYKKRQLEAIQSDRATLAALQGAIKDLGLQKQLDFMMGANGKVSAEADNTAKMDMPPAAGPAKN